MRANVPLFREQHLDRQPTMIDKIVSQKRCPYTQRYSSWILRISAWCMTLETRNHVPYE